MNQEQILINDNNINAIFDQKIEIGAVIQFNLLQRIIEEFIKRQKYLNDKINNLEIKINSGSVRPFSPKMSEENIFKYFEESKALDFEPGKEISIKEKEDNNANIIESMEEKEEKGEDKEKEKEEKKEKEKKTEKDKKGEKREKEVKEEKEEKRIIPEKIDRVKKTEKKVTFETNNNNNNNNDLETTDKKNEPNNKQYKILSSRIDKFEKILKEITKKVYSSKENNNNDENMTGEIKPEEKIKNIENEIDKIYRRLDEMNVLHINFSNDKDNEKEEGKSPEILKIFSKKIELIENRAKQCEEDIFKLKKDVNGINNALSSNKKNYNEFVIETDKNFSVIRETIKKEVNGLKKLINENDEKVKKELKDYVDNENKKIKDILEELENNAMNSGNESNVNTSLITAKFNEKLHNLNNDLKNLINKSSSETEKYLKSIINNLGIDKIREEISELYPILKEKLVKTDLDYIDLKIKDIENRIITGKLRIESLEKDVAGCNDATTKSVKMIEYLSGQFIQNNSPEINPDKRDDMLKGSLTINEKDIKSLVNKNEFTHEIKSIYKKIEQILEVESENYKFTQHIEGRLKFFVTQSDLKTMEQCLMNMIEELKSNFARKYMEKTEILKNFKFLEIKIKSLYDANPGMIKEGDNWLLAKKPLNNYLCASCEAYIGELKNKNTYLPWNKIPPHENKKYRMGNGFSRMLELVNTDLMKNAEKIKDNLIIKIDEKKTNSETINALPRLGSQINFKKLSRQNNTFYVMNNDNIDKRLNNSADGLEQGNIDSMNNKIKYNNLQENDSVGKNIDNVGGMGSKISPDKDSKIPKVLKIVKKMKKDI